MKKPKLKTEPIERVYKNGREAIVMAARKKKSGLTTSQLSKKLQPALSPATTLVSAAAEKKYSPSPIRINEYELPSYNTTKLTLIAKDPFWIYAYWELSNDSVEAIKRQLGGSLDGFRFVLRMYDVTYKDFNGANANHWFDIEVGRDVNNWYINLWHDNVSYCGEIGLLANDGRFFPMARSNFVQTPRASSSDRYDEIWMEVKSDFERLAIDKDFRAPRIIKTIHHIQQPKRRRIYLSEAELREYYSRMSPLLRKLMFSRRPRMNLFRYLYSKDDEKRLKDLIYLRGLSGKRVIKTGASEFMFLGASEQKLGASEFVKPDKKRKFFFEIGAELIVYGRTEPDAEVSLGNKKVDLRSDGTFSMRFVLPDGKIPLEFKAISKDKVDTRKITTTVERRTV